MGEELLSICIPTYNRCNYLKRALDSVWTDLNRYNIKVYVQDNASPDDTKSLMEDYMGERVLYERNDENLGGVANINILFEKAQGEYVIFLTDDDYFLPGGISKIISFIQSEQPDFLSMDMACYLEKTHAIYLNSAVNRTGIMSEEEAMQIYMHSNVLTRCCFRKQAVSDNTIYLRNNNVYPHQVAIMDLFVNHKTFAYIHEPLVMHTWENDIFWEKDFKRSKINKYEDMHDEVQAAQMEILNNAKECLGQSSYDKFCVGLFRLGAICLEQTPKHLQVRLRDEERRKEIKETLKRVIHYIGKRIL